MMATACFLAAVIELALGLWLLGECQFLIPYRAILVARYGRIVLTLGAVLFVNLFGLIHLAIRHLCLKDTGRKLAHFRRVWDEDASPADSAPWRADG